MFGTTLCHHIIQQMCHCIVPEAFNPLLPSSLAFVSVALLLSSRSSLSVALCDSLSLSSLLAHALTHTHTRAHAHTVRSSLSGLPAGLGLVTAYLMASSTAVPPNIPVRASSAGVSGASSLAGRLRLFSASRMYHSIEYLCRDETLPLHTHDSTRQSGA
jgi:uncharacterized membrane protein